MSNIIIRSDSLLNLQRLLPTLKEIAISEDLQRHTITLDKKLRIVSQMLHKDLGHEMRDFDLNNKRLTLGLNAIDFSTVSEVPSGASGDYSFSSGKDVTSSGELSRSFGELSVASGYNSEAHGGTLSQEKLQCITRINLNYQTSDSIAINYIIVDNYMYSVESKTADDSVVLRKYIINEETYSIELLKETPTSEIDSLVSYYKLSFWNGEILVSLKQGALLFNTDLEILTNIHDEDIDLNRYRENALDDNYIYLGNIILTSDSSDPNYTPPNQIVRVYNKNTGVLETLLESPSPKSMDRFGASIDVYYDKVIIGAPGDNKVYVYDKEFNVLHTFSGQDIDHDNYHIIIGENVLLTRNYIIILVKFFTNYPSEESDFSKILIFNKNSYELEREIINELPGVISSNINKNIIINNNEFSLSMSSNDGFIANIYDGLEVIDYNFVPCEDYTYFAFNVYLFSKFIEIISYESGYKIDVLLKDLTSIKTISSGRNSFSSGVGVKAIGDNSHSEGILTKAEGYNSFSSGMKTLAIGDNSMAFGESESSMEDIDFRYSKMISD